MGMIIDLRLTNRWNNLSVEGWERELLTVSSDWNSMVTKTKRSNDVWGAFIEEIYTITKDQRRAKHDKLRESDDYSIAKELELILTGLNYTSIRRLHTAWNKVYPVKTKIY